MSDEKKKLDGDSLRAVRDWTNSKFARVLLKPLTPPTTRKVVTIDTNGTQDNVDGTELTILMGNIVDSHGNKRFQDFNLGHDTIEGINFLYTKFSLAGTHLMLVTSIEVEENTTISSSASSNYGYIPLVGNIAFMANKIVPIGNTRIRTNTFNVYDENGTPIDTIRVVLNKESNNLVIHPNETKTYTRKVYATFQFDLLIDSD